MQGSAGVGQGQGQGLSEYFLGQQGGSESVTLLVSEIPVHTHTMNAAAGDPAESNVPTNFAMARSSLNVYGPSGSNVVQGAAEELAPAGASLPHNNMMPYLTLNFIIAMQGIFPPRG